LSGSEDPALRATAGVFLAATYVFDNGATEQQIQVECGAEPGGVPATGKSTFRAVG
jgi:hypothetical protein